MPGWTNTWKRGWRNLKNEPAAFAADWNSAAPNRTALKAELPLLMWLVAFLFCTAAVVNFGMPAFLLVAALVILFFWVSM